MTRNVLVNTKLIWLSIIGARKVILKLKKMHIIAYYLVTLRCTCVATHWYPNVALSAQVFDNAKSLKICKGTFDTSKFAHLACAGFRITNATCRSSVLINATNVVYATDIQGRKDLRSPIKRHQDRTTTWEAQEGTRGTSYFSRVLICNTIVYPPLYI